MSVSMNSISQIAPLKAAGTAKSLPKNGDQNGFATKLKEAINNVNDVQRASDQKTEALATGKVDDLHDVMITAQKASITLETTVQVQQKMIDAYNEVMRMQI